MVHSIIAGALRQRLILVVVALVLVGFGINAAQHLSVDAFPGCRKCPGADRDGGAGQISRRSGALCHHSHRDRDDRSARA